MNEMANKIKMLREQHSLTLEEVGNAVGVGKSTVRKWETGQIANMRRDKIAALAKALHTTPGYLMGWDDLSEPEIPAGFEPLPKTIKVPLVGRIACGEPITAEENIEDYVDAPEGKRIDFCLLCEGDSMIDAGICDGDVVFIHAQPDIENGQIAAVRIDNEATLKRVYKYSDHIVLQPANVAFAPMVYSGEDLDNIHIEGKAVGFQHWF